MCNVCLASLEFPVFSKISGICHVSGQFDFHQIPAFWRPPPGILLDTPSRGPSPGLINFFIKKVSIWMVTGSIVWGGV